MLKLGRKNIFLIHKYHLDAMYIILKVNYLFALFQKYSHFVRIILICLRSSKKQNELQTIYKMNIYILDQKQSSFNLAEKVSFCLCVSICNEMNDNKMVLTFDSAVVLRFFFCGVFKLFMALFALHLAFDVVSCTEEARLSLGGS